jgi:ubiquinone/menaquinone biosynthesis C-methylase UbiE
LNIDKIDKGNSFNWGLTSDEYAKYRDIYPDLLYTRLKELGVAADGTSWLDIGTGTGILIQNMYSDKAHITGVDMEAPQIEYARKWAAENGWDINYIVSPAEAANLPDNSFDTITAAQCFWYFDKEKMKSEIKRMLKPNGLFIKVYLTYTLDSEIAAKSHKLVKEFNRSWTPGKSGARDMYDDLFDGRVTEKYDCDISFTRESWHGRMCACRGTLASMDKSTFEKWSKAHKKMLEEYPEEFTVKHKLYITYFTIGAKRPDTNH